MPQPPVGYAQLLTQQRAAKDAFFRSSPQSPLTPMARRAFTGLSYYPIDMTLRLPGLRLRPLPREQDEVVLIGTSDGDYRIARRLGTFEFAIGGGVRTLTPFDLGVADHTTLVPFADATSVAETYPTGRYIDVLPDRDGTYVLDFNAAYHPLCAYSPAFTCPLTPAENILPDRIEAGERLAFVSVP